MGTVLFLCSVTFSQLHGTVLLLLRKEIRLKNDNIPPWRYISHPLHPCENLWLAGAWCHPKKACCDPFLTIFFRREPKNHCPSPRPKWPEVSHHLEVELDKTRRSQYLTVGFFLAGKNPVFFFSVRLVFFWEQWWLLSWHTRMRIRLHKTSTEQPFFRRMWLDNLVCEALKLSANTPENRPAVSQKERSSLWNHHFSGVNSLLVLGLV